MLDEEVDQGGVESPRLCCLAGDVGSLFGVEGLGDAVQVEAFLPELLEKVGNENRLRNTSGGNKASVFSVAESAGCVFSRTMVRQLPWEDVEGWEPCHPCFTRPLCRLYGAVELVAVQCVGIPMVIGLVPRVLEWWRGGRDVGRWGRRSAGAGSRC